MRQEITFIDAFTELPFSGNPAAVCLLDSALAENRMRQIAAEVNLSETAFLYPEGNGFHLRWFTPTSEVKLCGHATLASAHLLWERGAAAQELEFYTLSGTLVATRSHKGIVLNFPAEAVAPLKLPDGFLEALGCKPIFTGKTAVRYFVELASAADVRSINPDLSKLITFPPGRVIVTAKSDDSRYDFISRYFAPGIGIPEDPVTGAAHCALACYWSEKLGKSNFFAYQASARGGSLEVNIKGDRVFLTGKAVTMIRAEFAVDI